MGNKLVTDLFVDAFSELNKEELERRKTVFSDLLDQQKSLCAVFKSLNPTQAEVQIFEAKLVELLTKVIEYERVGFGIYMGVIYMMDEMNMPEEHQRAILEKMVQEHHLSA